ncbi:tetratricopeptide repeat protein [Actinoalloteichus sp. GBA129-24]|uniref:tetratricopeptide repeat protein n=1 Tax=Actinoalloteichus sp. GBA129-24 TaxID=1612551 RepID=UPI0009504A96|nr:tetratricopeptide repeat protein [Actinoalloteichus sp. GBA129-24]APU21302.1 hypothetical protein UA75_16470 [Actinoalloteichus sp. GBA129-24]
MDFYVIETTVLPRAARASRMVLPTTLRFGPVVTQIRDQPGPFEDTADALRWLRTEYDTLREALVAATRNHRDDLAWQLSETLWPLFLHHRHLVTPTVFTDGAAAAHRAAQTAQDPDHTRRHRLGQASLLLKAVAARLKLGDIDTAETLLPEATALTRHLDSPALQATARAQHGQLARARGSLTDAVDSFRDALRLEEQGGTPRGTSLRHRALASVLCDLGLHDQAETHLHHACELLTDSRDARDRAQIGEQLGTLRSLTGRHDDAVTELTRALTVLGDLPSHYQATCHRRLALALERRAAAALNTNPTPDHGDPLHTKATQDRRRAVIHRTRARELAPDHYTATTLTT